VLPRRKATEKENITMSYTFEDSIGKTHTVTIKGNVLSVAEFGNCFLHSNASLSS
jgi:hypothetical protein